jgi:hypothetical protein
MDGRMALSPTMTTRDPSQQEKRAEAGPRSTSTTMTTMPRLRLKPMKCRDKEKAGRSPLFLFS